MSGRSGRGDQRSLREIERAGILLTSPSIAGYVAVYRLRPRRGDVYDAGGDVRDRGGDVGVTQRYKRGTREARTSATSRVRRKYEDASTGPRQRLEALPVPDPGPAPTDEQRRELLSNIKTRLEALPKSEYPGVVKARSELDNWRKAGCPTEGFIIPFVRPSETEPITGSGCPDCGAASIIGGACAPDVDTTRAAVSVRIQTSTGVTNGGYHFSRNSQVYRSCTTARTASVIRRSVATCFG